MIDYIAYTSSYTNVRNSCIHQITLSYKNIKTGNSFLVPFCGIIAFLTSCFITFMEEVFPKFFLQTNDYKIEI